MDISYYWKNKQGRTELAAIHTNKMEKLYETDIIACEQNTSVYYGEPESVLPVYSDEMKVIVDNCGSVEAVMKYGNHTGNRTAVLNFASYKNPGGSFLNGSRAQEECLCHGSFLFNVLRRFDYVYEENNKHKNRGLYENVVIYSPDIRFVDNVEKSALCDVITCAAPNAGVARKYQNVSEEEITEVLDSRIHTVIKVAIENHVDNLILGAYGCGAFANNPETVAKIFCKYIKKYHCFKQVIFAIPADVDATNYYTFKRVISENKSNS